LVRNPSYIHLHEEGILENRIKDAINALNECRLCPRECGADRFKAGSGFCRTGKYAKVASFGPHFGEEAPLVGTHGSGTIFFSSCNLLCSFCQNHDISHGNLGWEVAPAELSSIMLELQRQGCHNINFVTPTHVMPQILEALPQAIRGGLNIPLVYNTSGYDSVKTLRMLEGIFDIYMPDFKFWDNQYARIYCNAPDYREIACKAIIEMHAQAGDLIIENGIAVKGALLRHLVMPEGISGTDEVMKFVAGKISKNTYVNVMSQYRPCFRAAENSTIDRIITKEEYSDALKSAVFAGLTRVKHNEFKPGFEKV
jgi:putative pyruvate formate lyase activating enzyme